MLKDAKQKMNLFKELKDSRIHEISLDFIMAKG